MSSPKPVLYKEGMLLKRQRGLHNTNTKKHKFQERFCCLTSTSLDYYDPLPKKRADGPKGQFAIDKMKIVEPMTENTFGKEYPYAIQIGDQTEVMYFVTTSKESQAEWLDAFKDAAKDSDVLMLTHHHHGVYGLINKGRWSCCANSRREFAGCTSCLLGAPTRQDLTMTLPRHTSTPTASNNSSNSSSLPRNVQPPKSAPLVFREKVPTTFVPPPMVRRFTTTNPKMKPNTKRLNELRKSRDFDLVIEKEGELLDFEDEVPLKIISEQDLPKPQSVNHEKKEDVNTSEGNGDEKMVVNSNGVRSGASSPALSVDSGHGTSTGSRPDSQAENSENSRGSRSGSLGKKPIQSVIQEQVATSMKETSPVTQTIVEDSDESSKTVTPTEHGTPVREENGSRDEPDRADIKTENGKEQDGKDKLMEDEVDSAKEKSIYHHTNSSPRSCRPPSSLQFISNNSSLGAQDRPTSICSLNDESIINNKRESMYESSSDVSISETPQQRKLKDRISASPRLGDRRSFLAKGLLPVSSLQEQCFFSPIHQSCRDGNLVSLELALGSCYQCTDLVDIEEPARFDEITYSPLFIAYINDHLQTMVKLLEYGANPNITEPVQKASVLHWACERGCLDIVDLLVKYKADVNKKDTMGNTPLIFACKGGHLDIVKYLLQHGAKVDDESAIGRTPLHQCSEGDHVEITEFLLKVGRANPTSKDGNELTPYDIAYNKMHKELLVLLQQVTPEVVRPYSLLHIQTPVKARMITSLSFKGNEIIVSGSRDCHASFLDTSDLSLIRSIQLPDTILDIDIHDHTHLVVGSTSVQIMDMDNPEKRRIIADDSNEDESLEDPPLHLVKFGPQGRLVTASAEGNLVRLWPAIVTHTTGIVTLPEALFLLKDNFDETGCVYCLSMSPSPNCPWLAVGFQPGEMFGPHGNKLVYVYNWDTKEVQQIFDAGDGGLEIGVSTMFSPCGNYLAIGCSKNLCIWDPKGGDLIQKFTIENDTSINSVCYSPDGTHLAVGLSSGEVQVFETTSSNSIFFLPRSSTKISPVTAMAYSENGKLFATAHKNGCIQLWEAYGPVLSNMSDDR